MKADSLSTNVLALLFVLCLLVGFLFPYSVFSFVYPLFLLLVILRSGLALAVASSFMLTPKEVVVLRKQWKPCIKTLPIAEEVFPYKQPSFVKVTFIPLGALLCICGAASVYYAITDQAMLGWALGVYFLGLGSFFVAICYLPLNDKFIATKDSLRLDTFMHKVEIPWAEILSVKEMSAGGSLTCRMYTTKKVFNFSDRLEGYDRLNELVRTALDKDCAA